MAQPPSIPKAASTPAKVPTIGFEVEDEDLEEVDPDANEPVQGPFPSEEEGAELMFLQAFRNVEPDLPDNRTTPRANPNQPLPEMDLAKRADVARNTLINQRPELAGHIDAAWRSARSRIGTDYKNSEDFEKNYFADAEADREKHKNLMKRLSDTPIQYIINAKTNTGREFQIARTGTAIDGEVASLFPEGSIEHQLLTADIDPFDPVWSRYQVGSEDTPKNRADIKSLTRT